MELFSVKLPIIKKNDSLLEIIFQAFKEQGIALKERDVIVISEKIVATSQGRIIHLNDVKKISKKAKKLAEKYEMDPRFVELILREATMVLGGLPHVLLAKVNDFLIANAGIDQSNAGQDNVVLLPENPKKEVWNYWKKFRNKYKTKELGVIFADSRVQPLRKGTIGVAVATAGFEPIEDLRGHPDLYNRPLEITLRAVADDLTSAAQFLLNEGDQQTPIVIIRGANIVFTENPTFSTEMPPEECLYMNIFSQYLLKKEAEEERKLNNGK
ncbi:MAG: coenzyme F420-0:L-glutamate ligase [Promethearchaeota archaeon]|nr:MAG: coenzyme F420-0:L-glutamate ligase [Candidatus Lokiarchaeota archaeon]